MKRVLLDGGSLVPHRGLRRSPFPREIQVHCCPLRFFVKPLHPPVAPYPRAHPLRLALGDRRTHINRLVTIGSRTGFLGSILVTMA